MTDVVIIAHNEGKYVAEVINSLPQHWHVIYIADRCTDNTHEELFKIKQSRDVTEVRNCNGIGRLTSYCRNLGFRYTRPSANVLFLDGDRSVVSGDISKIEERAEDVTLLMLEHDGRDMIDDYSKVYGTVHNAFYSCGVFVKRAALERIYKFQEGKIFREDMQAMWGIEDTFLGDVCYHLGLTADLYRGCRLRGKFDKCALDSLDAIELRLTERDKLNVKWC